MSTTNAVAQSRLRPPGALSFDDRYDSEYPSGNKPSGYQTTPRIVCTDVMDGPITGGLTGNGVPISIIGYSFGKTSDLGNSAGAKVFVRDPLGDNAWHEVLKYWYLVKARTYNWNQLLDLCVEIGSIPGANTPGHALDLKVTVNGVDSAFYPAAFTIQPGDFYYVSASGNDATGLKNSSGHPYRLWQNCTSGTHDFPSPGIWAPGNLQAGDTIMGSGGTYSDQTGYDSRWIRFRLHTGSPATGTVGNGSIKIISKPTLFGREDVHYQDPAGGAGGIHGVNTAYSGLYGQYVTVAGLRLECSATTVSDGGPLNLQSGANGWRCVNNEIGPWPSTVPSPNNARAGAIAGQGDGVYLLANWVHDISCDPAALENHGFYLGDAAGICCKNTEVAYNVATDITGGSSFQCNNNAASDTFSNINVHHNFFDTAAKYNVNFNDTTSSAKVWNNVLLNGGRNCFRIGSWTSGAVITFAHNTCRLSGSSSAYKLVACNEGSPITSGLLTIQHNIFVLGPGASASGCFYTNFADSNVSLQQNLYFDESGTLTTIPTVDTNGVYGDPEFTSISNRDYTVKSGSATLGACSQSSVLAIPDDYYGVVRPVATTGTPGGFKNDIGAMQGTGT